MVITVGDIMLDIYVQEPGRLNRDTDTRGSTSLMWGGSAANFAVWAARLGLDSCLVGRVGADFVGEAALADLAEEGVRAIVAKDPGSATGTVVVRSRGADGREMICDRKANANFSESDLPLAELLLSDWVHISGYTAIEELPRRAVRTCIKHASSGKATISVDPGSCSLIGSIGPARFLDAVEGADFLFPNREEAGLITGLSHPEDMAGALLGRFPAVAIKLGPDGALYADRTGSIGRVPASDARARDVNGAGDAFGAAFVATFIRTGDLRRSAEAGCALAGLVVGADGARPEVALDGIRRTFLGRKADEGV